MKRLRYLSFCLMLSAFASPASAAYPLGPYVHAASAAYAISPGHYHHAVHADVVARYYAAQRPWHGPYAYTPWGVPAALVVPPTSKQHTSFSWGVAQTEMVPIYHQFHRDYPGGIAIGGGAGINPTTPLDPSSPLGVPVAAIQQASVLQPPAPLGPAIRADMPVPLPSPATEFARSLSRSPEGLRGVTGSQAFGRAATPYWPSHTDQIGIFPVRGPW